MPASRPVRPSADDLCIGGLLVLDQGLTFGLQRDSLHRISSIAILAAAQIPVQMEFLVGTGQKLAVNGRNTLEGER